MFAIRDGVVFWDKQTNAIHEMEDIASFEPQIKEYYAKLGTVLSELLVDPSFRFIKNGALRFFP